MEKLGGSTDTYIGSVISVTSKREIRYEGTLFTLNTEKSTMVLKDVRSFGTEGRGKNTLQISASDEVYEYIIFRVTDIQDLNVLSLPQKSDKPNNGTVSEAVDYSLGVKNLEGIANSQSIGVGLGWPVSPPLLGLQGSTNWWQWIFPPMIPRSNCVSPITPLTTVPDVRLQIGTLNSFASSPPLQGGYGTLVLKTLADFEQVPAAVSAEICNAEKSAETVEQVEQQVSASEKQLIAGNLTVSKGNSPQRKHIQNKPCKIQALLQQPLLPLPVSETEHRRLIKENLCFINPDHSRRQRSCWRGRIRGGHVRTDDPTRTCCEARNSTQEFSRDFDFEAMNEQFNKKEIWQDLEHKENETAGNDGGQNYTAKNAINNQTIMYNSSKKLLFVDDFFDLLSSDGCCKENGAQGTTHAKQLQIDTETFGNVPSRRGRGPRRGHRRGAVCTGHEKGQQTKVDSQGEKCAI